MQDPLKLPRPPSWGYLGDLQTPIQRTQPKLPQVEDPAKAFPQQEMQMPDVVKVRYGAGDKAIVGALLKAVNGEDSGLTGVSSTYAAKMLQGWGYPTTADAWTSDQWKQALDANAAMTNPMGMLGGY
jgi:hypothetical protein